MDDIDAMFSDMLQEMDLLTQVLYVYCRQTSNTEHLNNISLYSNVKYMVSFTECRPTFSLCQDGFNYWTSFCELIQLELVMSQVHCEMSCYKQYFILKCERKLE